MKQYESFIVLQIEPFSLVPSLGDSRPRNIETVGRTLLYTYNYMHTHEHT